MDIVERLETWAGDFQAHLEQAVSPNGAVPEDLRAAVRYALLAPGKRLRPFLLERCYRACGGVGEQVWRLAAAVECVHVFTLIHDDLPAMDDAPLRRGQPSTHAAYGEAVAILAGDALLALGFELIAGSGYEPGVCLEMVRDLSNAIGWAGVIGGQAIDVMAEAQAVDRHLIDTIHHHKTARLFECCCRLGAIAAGADAAGRRCLGDFGLHLGLAFQIADDILDVTSSAQVAGKQVGRDASQNKQTYPRAVGLEESRRAGLRAVQRALGALDGLDGPAAPAEELRSLAGYILARTH